MANSALVTDNLPSAVTFVSCSATGGGVCGGSSASCACRYDREPARQCCRNSKSTSPTRGYYLTSATFDGSHALAACTTGYHMASAWEVHEPSNLRYDTNLEFNLDDSGLGPPTGSGGWIRTGFVSNVTGNTGVVNCGVWSSNSAFDNGTQVWLEQDYINSGPASTPWFGQLQPSQSCLVHPGLTIANLIRLQLRNSSSLRVPYHRCLKH